MSQRMLRGASLYLAQLEYDRDLAQETRRAGCPLCGAQLHSARYPRKPRDEIPVVDEADPDDDLRRRFSFCCAREGCRKRATPPSTRFLPRRHYLAATVVLVSAMVSGLTRRRVARLRELYGVSLRTLERWRRWWREQFAASDLWRARGADLVPPVAVAMLPRSLIERFGAVGSRTGLLRALRWLAPLSAGDHVRRRVLASPQRTRFDPASRRP